MYVLCGEICSKGVIAVLLSIRVMRVLCKGSSEQRILYDKLLARSE